MDRNLMKIDIEENFNDFDVYLDGLPPYPDMNEFTRELIVIEDPSLVDLVPQEQVDYKNPLVESNAIEQTEIPILDATDRNERGPPNRSPMPGPYEFVVEVNSTHTDKKKYVFSHKLNRIYVDRDKDFPVQFNWRAPAGMESANVSRMFVRATTVFADEAQAQKRVQQCVSHYHHCLSNNASARVARNVLHSSRGAAARGVTYCGDPDAGDSWLSVLVELHKPGLEPVTHAYKFVCTNSCSTGINRRAIAIIFTLEDGKGGVVGRQVVGARACACPRRDMLKDEETEGPRGKRRLQPPAPASATTGTKRVKVEHPPAPPPGELFILPQLQLTTPRAAVTGLEMMISIEEQTMENPNVSNNPELLERTKRCIAHLKQVQDTFK